MTRKKNVKRGRIRAKKNSGRKTEKNGWGPRAFLELKGGATRQRDGRALSDEKTKTILSCSKTKKPKMGAHRAGTRGKMIMVRAQRHRNGSIEGGTESQRKQNAPAGKRLGGKRSEMTPGGQGEDGLRSAATVGRPKKKKKQKGNKIGFGRDRVWCPYHKLGGERDGTKCGVVTSGR